jgi:ABC-type amino acid transport substrate-binding protein
LLQGNGDEPFGRGRADFYLDNKNILEILWGEMGLPRNQYDVFHIMDMKLFIGFHDGPRQRALAEAFDEAMDRMAATGELREIAGRHGKLADYAAGQSSGADP